MNKKAMAMVVAMMFLLVANAEREMVDGYTWEYTVESGTAKVTSCTPLTGDIVVPKQLGGYPVLALGNYIFADKRSMNSVVIPQGVHTVGSYAFCNCYSVKVCVPFSVTNIGTLSFCGATVDWDVAPNVTFDRNNSFDSATFSRLRFLSSIPNGFMEISRVNYNGAYYCKRAFGSVIGKAIASKMQFGGYFDDVPEVEIVSSAVRENDPTVMDVVYKVYSDKTTVKVRALAFQDGQRNLAKAVPVKTLIEGTDANIGDSIAANVEHKLSWKVSADWATDLAKVKFEVLAVEDDLLPLELQTIPATANHAAMKISWNRLTDDKVFDALLWLYADGDTGLTLTNGQLKNGGTILASGTGIYNGQSAVAYVFGKMGYGVLSGSDLTYARRVTQLDLPVGGIQQFAVKTLAQ